MFNYVGIKIDVCFFSTTKWTSCKYDWIQNKALHFSAGLDGVAQWPIFSVMHAYSYKNQIIVLVDRTWAWRKTERTGVEAFHLDATS